MPTQWTSRCGSIGPTRSPSGRNNVEQQLAFPPAGHEPQQTPAGVHLSREGAGVSASLRVAESVPAQWEWLRLSTDADVEGCGCGLPSGGCVGPTDSDV